MKRSYLVPAILVLIGSTSVLAAPPHETFFETDLPTAQQVAAWSSLPGTRSYLFQTENPSASDLKTLASLQGADQIQIEVSEFPSESTIPAWKALADQGVELVGFRSGLPTASEVTRLNEAGFSKYVFVISYYPSASDAALLGQLHGKVSLTFAKKDYPRYTDRAGLNAIPASAPLLFVTDYWPFYSQMDLLNLLPQPQRLRVIGGMMPSQDELPYLRNLKRLTDISIESGFDPQITDWEKLAGFDVTWTCTDHIPSAESLQAFAASGHGKDSRKLVLNQDYPLTQEQHDLIWHSPLPTEWIHQPFSNWRTQ